MRSDDEFHGFSKKIPERGIYKLSTIVRLLNMNLLLILGVSHFVKILEC